MHKFSRSIVRLFSVGAAIATFTLSCQYDNKTSTLDTQDPEELNQLPDNAVQLKIDSSISIATWIGTKPTGRHDGYIPVRSGAIAISQDQEILKGQIIFDVKNLIVMDLKDDTTKQRKLYDHLMSEDFFAADSFPTATFDIVKVIPYDSSLIETGDQQMLQAFEIIKKADFVVENPSHFISGNLQMRGVNRNIVFPAEISWSNDKLITEAKLNLDRTDWNLSYGDESTVIDRAKDKFIFNTVHIGLSIQASPSKDD